jgi:hypothetical protein
MPRGVPPESGAIAFAERVLTLLDDGSFTATYKYAVLRGLIDLCITQVRVNSNLTAARARGAPVNSNLTAARRTCSTDIAERTLGYLPSLRSLSATPAEESDLLGFFVDSVTRSSQLCFTTCEIA